MVEREPQLAEDLYERVHAVAEQLDHIRDEAAVLSADLRNRLRAAALERRAVRRLEDNRQERIERQSGRADASG